MACTAIPVVDVKVTCFDGKYHSVDSSEMSFKMAGSLGFKDAMAKAGAVVLEPVSLLKVTVPAEYQGDVMGDINARRGRVQGTDAVGGGEQEVTALVPTSEIMRYAIDLRSMTGGRGRFTATHDHYDPMPSHLVDKLREAEGRSALSDLSPADAVVAARSFARRLKEAIEVAPPADERSPSAIRDLASRVATVLDDTTRRLGGSAASRAGR